MKRVALAVVLLLGMGVSEASAHYDDDLAASLVIARAAFPTACEPTIPAEHSTHELWPSALMWSNSAAFSGRPDAACQVGMNPAVHDMRPSSFCTALVHEFGHLAGLNHSSDPTSIMATPPPIYEPCRVLDPQPTKRKGRPKICTRKAKRKRHCGRRR